MIQEQFQAKLNVWRRTAKTFLRSSSCYTSVSGMLQHESKNSKTMGPFGWFLKTTSQAQLQICFNMSQKMTKLRCLSALATKLFIQTNFLSSPTFYKCGWFLKRLTVRLIASDVERPNDLAVVSIASASLLKTASIKSNDLTLKLPRVVSFLICYILGSKKCI